MGGAQGIEVKATRLLEAMNVMGGYLSSLVCTEDGLLIASAGADIVVDEEIAGFTGLFDSIVVRAIRDLGFQRIDEVTLLDDSHDRLVLRPLPVEGTPRLFLVVRVPPNVTWRRHTNKISRDLADLLAPLITPTKQEDARQASD